MNCVRDDEKRDTVFPVFRAKDEVTEADLVQICIPAQLAYSALARSAVDTAAREAKMSADNRNALKLAVGEACNNAVQYGNASSPSASVFVACRVFPDRVEVDVISEGDGFNPRLGNHKMPLAEEFAESGRGLALIEFLMDSVEYDSFDGYFRVRIGKFFHSRETP